MTLDNVSVPLALAAGAASFLSPCVLPLVPVYVSYLARTRGGAEAGPTTSLARGLLNAAAFMAGVTVVVIALFYALRTVLQQSAARSRRSPACWSSSSLCIWSGFSSCPD